MRGTDWNFGRQRSAQGAARTSPRGAISNPSREAWTCRALGLDRSSPRLGNAAKGLSEKVAPAFGRQVPMEAGLVVQLRSLGVARRGVRAGDRTAGIDGLGQICRGAVLLRPESITKCSGG